MPFTAEELAEMARADAEIEAGFFVTNEEFALSRERDREAALAAMDPQKRKLAESQRRYYAANKEKVAESQRRYYAANKEKVAESQRRYYAANKEKVAESQRRYRAANKEKVAESKQAIKVARLSAGLTQRATAHLFGVSQQSISVWENISAPENWREIVEIILTKGKAAAPAGTRTTAVTINH